MAAGFDSTAVCGISVRCSTTAWASQCWPACSRRRAVWSWHWPSTRADAGEVLRAINKDYCHHQAGIPTQKRRRQRKGESCSGGAITRFLEGPHLTPRNGC